MTHRTRANDDPDGIIPPQPLNALMQLLGDECVAAYRAVVIDVENEKYPAVKVVAVALGLSIQSAVRNGDGTGMIVEIRMPGIGDIRVANLHTDPFAAMGAGR